MVDLTLSILLYSLVQYSTVHTDILWLRRRTEFWGKNMPNATRLISSSRFFMICFRLLLLPPQRRQHGILPSPQNEKEMGNAPLLPWDESKKMCMKNALTYL